MTAQKTGQLAEQKALDHLIEKGLKLVLRNYRCHWGEVDIIMRDGSYLVVIEVRSRRSMGYGGGIGSITHVKRQKIIKTTSHYMMIHQLHERFPVRFDVVSIDGKSGAITWLKDAFGLDY